MPGIDVLCRLGYLGIVVGGLVDSETAAVLGGLAAAQGELVPAWVFLAAMASGVVGDTVGFLLGRTVGSRIVDKRESVRVHVDGARRLLARRPGPVVIGLRFMWGIRAAMAMAIGMSRISFKRFLVLDMIGAAIWAAALVGGSYLCGNGFALLISRFRVGGIVVAALAIAVLCMLFVVRAAIARRSARLWQDAPSPGEARTGLLL